MDEMMSTDGRQELNPPLSILQMLKPPRSSAADSGRKAVLVSKAPCCCRCWQMREFRRSVQELVLCKKFATKLSLDMGTANTSRSNSSTIAAADEQGDGSASPEARGSHKDMTMMAIPMIQDSIVAQTCALNSPSCRRPGRRRKTSRSRVRYNRKGPKWLQLDC